MESQNSDNSYATYLNLDFNSFLSYISGSVNSTIEVGKDWGDSLYNTIKDAGTNIMSAMYDNVFSLNSPLVSNVYNITLDVTDAIGKTTNYILETVVPSIHTTGECIRNIIQDSSLVPNSAILAVVTGTTACITNAVGGAALLLGFGSPGVASGSIAAILMSTSATSGMGAGAISLLQSAGALFANATGGSILASVGAVAAPIAVAGAVGYGLYCQNFSKEE